MNVAAFEAVRSIDDVHYVGPIDPPPMRRQKALSKLKRLLGFQGDFFFFSHRRLAAIAGEVQQRCSKHARLDFFHGFTPWILIEPPRPYVAWSDCIFRDYIDIYHRRARFRGSDLDRIERAEADWLRRAVRVGFSSRWAAQRALEHYGLDQSAVRCVGIFGEFEWPRRDEYCDSKQFVFVSTDFKAKGGPVVLAAFQRVRERHPDASLVVVGTAPDAEIGPGVRYAGFLRKENDEEKNRFCRIMAQSRALVHPTKSDISPLIVVEAACFGCPAISSRMFAIPELIDDRRGGILLDNPASIDEIAGAMLWMLENNEQYRLMRKAAWKKARVDHSKARHSALLGNAIREALGEPLAATLP